MSDHLLSVERELRYIVQWFNEWSELQRDDFLPIVTEYLVKNDPTAQNGIYINGIVGSMTTIECTDKPMSLFQCRVKLFREWSVKWPEDLKQRLREKIQEIDEKFIERIDKEISTGSDDVVPANNDLHLNGNGLLINEIINGDEPPTSPGLIIPQNNEPLLA